MAEIINLNRVRKSKTLLEKRLNGNANAAKFGRKKVEKQRDEALAGKVRRDLDGHERE